MERMEVGAMAQKEVTLNSVLRPNLRYIVPSHNVRVKTTKAKITESAGDRKGRVKHNVKLEETDEGLFVTEPGPAIVQFEDGKAKVALETWEAMTKNNVAHGLGVFAVDAPEPDPDADGDN